MSEVSDGRHCPNDSISVNQKLGSQSSQNAKVPVVPVATASYPTCIQSGVHRNSIIRPYSFQLALLHWQYFLLSSRITVPQGYTMTQPLVHSSLADLLISRTSFFKWDTRVLCMAEYTQGGTSVTVAISTNQFVRHSTGDLRVRDSS